MFFDVRPYQVSIISTGDVRRKLYTLDFRRSLESGRQSGLGSSPRRASGEERGLMFSE